MIDEDGERLYLDEYGEWAHRAKERFNELQQCVFELLQMICPWKSVGGQGGDRKHEARGEFKSARGAAVWFLRASAWPDADSKSRTQSRRTWSPSVDGRMTWRDRGFTLGKVVLAPQIPALRSPPPPAYYATTSYLPQLPVRQT